jgi:hypothetical protein
MLDFGVVGGGIAPPTPGFDSSRRLGVVGREREPEPDGGKVSDLLGVGGGEGNLCGSWPSDTTDPFAFLCVRDRGAVVWKERGVVGVAGGANVQFMNLSFSFSPSTFKPTPASASEDAAGVSGGGGGGRGLLVYASRLDGDGRGERGRFGFGDGGSAEKGDGDGGGRRGGDGGSRRGVGGGGGRGGGLDRDFNGDSCGMRGGSNEGAVAGRGVERKRDVRLFMNDCFCRIAGPGPGGLCKRIQNGVSQKRKAVRVE